MKRNLLQAIKFKDSNQVWKGEEGIKDLHVYNDGEVLHSCWYVPFWQRFILLWTGKIWLGVMTQKQPPVRVDVLPFYNEAPK